MPTTTIPEIPVSNLHNPLAAVAQSVNVVAGAVNQLAQNAPTNTSDLTNDSGFITRLVDDLANYYTKSETYTKAEVNALISAIPKLDIQVVSALPASDISTETIYLLTSGAESQNLYTEYIYVNDAWEKLGTQTLDLSGYATTAAMNAALSGKVDKDGAKGLSTNDFTDAYKAKLDSALTEHQSLANYALKSELPTVPTNVSAFTNDSGYLTAQDVAGLQDSASQQAIDAAQNTRLTNLETENALLRELVNGIDAPIYRSASGNPATFADGYPANVRNLVVTLTPTQSGSGDPSPDNIRPISGATSVSVTRTGKNRCPLEVVTTTTNGLTFTVDQNAGTVTVNGTASAQTLFYLNAFSDRYAGNRWIFTGCPSDGNDAVFSLRVYKGGSGYATETGSGSAMTGTENLRLGILVRNGVTMSNKVFYPMIRLASETDATFAPYRGQSVRVSLVGSNSATLTVYGGTLDVTSGTLTVNTKFMTFTGVGDEFANNYAGGNGLRVFALPADAWPVADNDTTGNILCSHAPTVSANALWNSAHAAVAIGAATPAGRVQIDGVRNLDEMRAWMSAQNSAGTPLQILYRLATPVTYQLTAAQLATLSGYNAVSVDTGTLSVEYRADPTITLGGG